MRGSTEGSSAVTRVARFHELGGPEVLRIEELPLVDPGPGEARVRLDAIGLNRADASFRRGRYLEVPRALPSSLGCEGAGTVEALGPGTQGLSVGDAVSILPSFSVNEYTVYGEHAVVPAGSLVERPSEVDAVTGAAVWMPYLTAWGALIEHAAISAGDTVLMTAASSSVGLAAIQVAHGAGATAIAVTRTSGKRSRLEQAGADHVVAADEEDIVEEVHRITDGRGASVTLDPIAGPGVKTLAAATAKGGTLFVYGNLSGEPTPFPRIALSRALCLRGYLVFEITSDARRMDRARAFVLNGLRDGELEPTIDRTFRFDEIVDAHRHLESNTQVGKIVVTVD